MGAKGKMGVPTNVVRKVGGGGGWRGAAVLGGLRLTFARGNYGQ